jgi:hypothetical protein
MGLRMKKDCFQKLEIVAMVAGVGRLRRRTDRKAGPSREEEMVWEYRKCTSIRTLIYTRAGSIFLVWPL